MASAHSKFVSVSLCSVFNLNNRISALFARQLPGFTCTRSLTTIVSELVQVNPETHDSIVKQSPSPRLSQ